MRWALVVILVLVLLVGVVVAVGAMLPQSHIASVRATYAKPPEVVYGMVSDVGSAPSWRPEVERVEILSGPDEPLRWRETGSFRVITFSQQAAEPPARFIAHIDDAGGAFGGTWTYEIAPAPGGSTLTLTEAGEVYNPVFRFMSKFIFGHYGTMESYAKSLGTRFGEEVTPERVR
jgi:hypothetical protein